VVFNIESREQGRVYAYRLFLLLCCAFSAREREIISEFTDSFSSLIKSFRGFFLGKVM